MRENNLLDKTVNIPELAKMTKNYTGAEIQAVCRAANQFALFSEDTLKQLESQAN